MFKNKSCLLIFLCLVFSISVQSEPYSKFISKFDTPLREFIDRGFKNVFEQPGSTIIKPLEGGFSSAQLYKIEDGKEAYVLRVLPDKFDIVRRQAEHEGHKIAASLGVAPKVLYAGPEGQVMIMAFIEGRALNIHDMTNPQILKGCAQVLKKIHGYKLPFPFQRTQVDRTKDHIEKAKKKFSVYPKGYDALYKHYLEDERKEDGKDLVFNHGDLNLTNFILTPKGDLYLIDWPNASMDHRFVDLGAFVLWSGMNNESAEVFLQEYLGKRPDAEALSNLVWGQKRAAFYVATLWLRFVDKDAYEWTKEARQKEIDQRFSEKLRPMRDYLQKGEVVPIISPNKTMQNGVALPKGDRHKRMDYGLAFLKAYKDWPKSDNQN